MRGSRGRGGLGRIMVGLMMMSLSVTLGILLVLYEYFLLFMYGLQWRGVPSALQRQVLLELLPGDVGLRGVVDLLLHSLAS